MQCRLFYVALIRDIFVLGLGYKSRLYLTSRPENLATLQYLLYSDTLTIRARESSSIFVEVP